MVAAPNKSPSCLEPSARSKTPRPEAQGSFEFAPGRRKSADPSNEGFETPDCRTGEAPVTVTCTLMVSRKSGYNH